MAISWASKRKLLYALLLALIIIVIIVVPLFYFFYKAPTCFDMKQNGRETGIDCGGKCKRLCQSAFLPPRIEWGGARFEKVADGFYNVASYIVNPNINGAAIDVPYKITLYDAEGVFITQKTGSVDLHPRRNSLAFSPLVKTDKRIPAKATFEFLSPPEWFKATDNLEGIVVYNKQYTENDNGSNLQVDFMNKTLYPYSNVLVSVVLYDVKGNVIGFSQTKVDSIQPSKSTSQGSGGSAFYTWPIKRNSILPAVEVLPSIRLVEGR
jgi:hypothetical protein